MVGERERERERREHFSLKLSNIRQIFCFYYLICFIGSFLHLWCMAPSVTTLKIFLFIPHWCNGNSALITIIYWKIYSLLNTVPVFLHILIINMTKILKDGSIVLFCSINKKTRSSRGCIAQGETPRKLHIWDIKQWLSDFGTHKALFFFMLITCQNFFFFLPW